MMDHWQAPHRTKFKLIEWLSSRQINDGNTVSPNLSPFLLSTQVAGLDEHEMQMDEMTPWNPLSVMSGPGARVRHYQRFPVLYANTSWTFTTAAIYRYPIDTHTHTFFQVPKAVCSLNGGQVREIMESALFATGTSAQNTNPPVLFTIPTPGRKYSLILYPRSRSQNLPRVNFTSNAVVQVASQWRQQREDQTPFVERNLIDMLTVINLCTRRTVLSGSQCCFCSPDFPKQSSG